jgi:Double-GTPase 1
MTGRDARQLLMAGFQETGKTSFLALFYTALVNRGTELLELASYQDDREYLNEINRRLLRCEPAVHTEMQEQRELALSLTVRRTGEPASLRIPDLSGETWDHAVLNRAWSRDTEQQVRESEAVLLFLHPDKIDAGPTIGALAEAVSALSGERQEGSGADDPDTEQEAAAAMVGDPPTQVLLTDLLQLVVEQRGPRPARACLLVSAWDRLPQPSIPGDFISTNLPLLSQYISSNQDWLSVRTYGVSAQGGDFEDADSRHALVKEDAVERSFVVDGAGQSVTIESPVAWALGLSDQ